MIAYRPAKQAIQSQQGGGRARRHLPGGVRI
jgi:hypothetical protein